MSAAVKEMAKAYYPRMWSKARLEMLVNAGRLSQEDMDEIVAMHEESEE